MHARAACSRAGLLTQLRRALHRTCCWSNRPLLAPPCAAALLRCCNRPPQVEVMRALDHPNLVKLFEVIEDQEGGKVSRLRAGGVGRESTLGGQGGVRQGGRGVVGTRAGLSRAPGRGGPQRAHARLPPTSFYAVVKGGGAAHPPTGWRCQPTNQPPHQHQTHRRAIQQQQQQREQVASAFSGSSGAFGTQGTRRRD